MSRIPRQAKRDAAEKPIVAVLEAAGCFVVKHSGRGEPDLFVSRPSTHTAAQVQWCAVEVKSGAGGHTEAQQTWTGPAPVVIRSVWDAATFILEWR